MEIRSGKKMRKMGTRKFVSNGKLCQEAWPECSVLGCSNLAEWIEDGLLDGAVYCNFHFNEVGAIGTKLSEYAGQEIPGREVLMEAKGKSEFGKFCHMADDGREPLMAVASFFLAENTFSAMEIICRGNNWQTISCALGGMFHIAEYNSRQIDLRVLKARGYDRLRGIVSTCMADLFSLDLRLPNGYDRLVNRLFTSQGLPTP